MLFFEKFSANGHLWIFFKKWQLKSIGVLRIESLVKSQAVSVKGVSHVILFARSIGCYNITKMASVIGHEIKLYVIQRLRGAGLLVFLAFTYNTCWRLNLPDINDFFMALWHQFYFIIFKIVQKCLVWMGQC